MRRMFKVFGFLGLILGLSMVDGALAAPKGEHMTYRNLVKQGKNEQVSFIETYARKGALRMEVKESADGEAQMVFISKNDGKKQYALFPTQKMYMDLTEGARHMQSKRQREGKKSQDHAFEKTSRTAKVAGQSCQIWERKEKKAREEVCLADDVRGGLGAFSDQFSDDMRQQYGLPKGFSGSPLYYTRWEGKKRPKMVGDFRMVSHKSTELKDALFDVPSNYKNQTVDVSGVLKSMDSTVDESDATEEAKKGLKKSLRKAFGL